LKHFTSDLHSSRNGPTLPKRLEDILKTFSLDAPRECLEDFGKHFTSLSEVIDKNVPG